MCLNGYDGAGKEETCCCSSRRRQETCTGKGSGDEIVGKFIPLVGKRQERRGITNFLVKGGRQSGSSDIGQEKIRDGICSGAVVLALFPTIRAWKANGGGTALRSAIAHR